MEMMDSSVDNSLAVDDIISKFWSTELLQLEFSAIENIKQFYYFITFTQFRVWNSIIIHHNRTTCEIICNLLTTDSPNRIFIQLHYTVKNVPIYLSITFSV